MRPSASRNCGATILLLPFATRHLGTPVPATRESPACRLVHPSCASSAFRLTTRADVEIRVSSMTSLTICWRINIPLFFQRLADLGLGELFLLRPIFINSARLPVLRDKLRRFHIVGFPIEIENLILGTQKVFRVPMAFQTPSHAV